MSEKVNSGTFVLAGVTTAAAAAIVVGHMLVLDWIGRKLREYIRQA